MEIKTTYRHHFKPLADCSLALILILALSPVLVAISLILLIHNQPVLFRHPRPGFNGRLFKVCKFTTMTGAGKPTPFLFGRFLRRTSLDELPQLFNVLKGEMSLVGPRPLLKEYLDKYTPEQGKRHLVKPGITGWAQVNGRNTVSFEAKMDLDLFYVEKLSWRLDLKILIMTVSQILKWREADFFDVAVLKPEV